jgi:hypothetical protein
MAVTPLGSTGSCLVAMVPIGPLLNSHTGRLGQHRAVSPDELGGFLGPATGVDGAADDKGLVAVQVADSFHRLRGCLLPFGPQPLGDALGDALGGPVLAPIGDEHVHCLHFLPAPACALPRLADRAGSPASGRHSARFS